MCMYHTACSNHKGYPVYNQMFEGENFRGFSPTANVLPRIIIIIFAHAL